MLISIGQMPCNLICVAAISQQSNPSQISFQFPSKCLHLNISFFDWGQVFFADRPIASSESWLLKSEKWIVKEDFEGIGEKQIYRFSLSSSYGWAESISWNNIGIFSGCIAPWLYCLKKTWPSSCRLNSQISLAIFSEFFGYIASWQDSQKILAI